MYISPSVSPYVSQVRRPAAAYAIRVGMKGPIRRGQGLGDDDGPSNQQIATGATSGLLVGASTAQSTGSAIAGAAAGTLLAIAPFTGPAAPFIAAAGVLIGPILKMFSGCGATCTQATTIANQAEVALEQLVNQYFAQPVRYKSAQTAALSAIQQVFTALQTSCSSPSLGTAGQNCINQRLNASACQWRSSPYSFNGCTYTPAGPNGSGTSCWNWIVGYYNPIANDPCVVDDPVSSATDSVLSAFGVSPTSTIAGLPATDVMLGVLVLLGLALL
jgi:hypothetical protein